MSTIDEQKTATSTGLRQVTVLFCDLVGSTELSFKLDPEELASVIDDYRGSCQAVADHFGGIVRGYAGDGVRIDFGHPRAHEDDPERAVRAALELLDKIRALRTPSAESLQARVGIATSNVAAVDGSAVSDPTELLIVGDAPNLAARLQARTEPNSIVIAEGTRLLVGGTFDLIDRGLHELKGFPRPERIWQVTGISGIETRFEAAHPKGSTPLVNRKRELDMIERLWGKAKDGHGQVVLVTGEAGIGKSRIVQAVREHVSTESGVQLLFQCSPYYQHTALYPVIRQIEHDAAITRSDEPETRFRKLETLLRHSSTNPQGIVPLFGALLSLPKSSQFRLREMSGAKQKEETLVAIVQRLEGLVSHGPLLVIIEDVHWIDPTSLELIGRLIVRAPRLQMMILITCRPEFFSPWGNFPHVSDCPVGRLSPEYSTELMQALSGRKALPDDIACQILSKSDGLPLWVQELTKTVLASRLLTEAGGRYFLTSSVESIDVPNTLRDSLMARLDQIAPIKHVAQLGATIGREFSYELLVEVMKPDDHGLKETLGQLADAGIIFVKGRPPNATCKFTHALLRDTAYESLLKRQRTALHKKIVRTIESTFPELAETEPEFLAHHCTEAGETLKAIKYWRAAGERAAARSAHKEACHHIEKCIDLLAELPDKRQRMELELTLRIVLGPSQAATGIYSTHHVEHNFARAMQLCEELGDRPEAVEAYSGAAAHFYVKGTLTKALGLAEECIALAERWDNTGDRIDAHRVMGELLFYMGDLKRSCEHLHRCIELYDPATHRELFKQTGDDPAVAAYMYLSIALWLLGYPEQASGKLEEGLDLANSVNHVVTSAQADLYAAWFHAMRREESAAEELARRSIRRCQDYGVSLYEGLNTVLLGWVLARRDRKSQGIEQMQTGMDIILEEEAGICLTTFQPWLAEGLCALGRSRRGLRLLDESIGEAENCNEHVYDAERMRLRGELLVLQGADLSEVAGCYESAMKLARERGMRSLELRAALSLVNLWRTQAGVRDARPLLRGIYEEFNEGFDTPDLKEARTVLEEVP